MSEPTYTAAIGTASDVVSGDYCDVVVVENESTTVGYREDADGDEVPAYSLTNKVVMAAVDTTVRTDDEDKLFTAGDAADDILRANGWRRISDWGTSDNALYAHVERY